jgi:uncharacterized protein YutE (UPF0331/DUF86 family)
MRVEKTIQLILDDVPIIESYSENKDPEVSEKIAAKRAQICIEKVVSILNRTVTTRA